MSKNTKQTVIEITPQGVLKHDKLEIGTLCFADPARIKAWELDYAQQAKDEKSGEFVQFVSSLNKQPLRIYTNRPRMSGKTTSVIAAQQFDEKLQLIQKQNQKQSMLLWLGIFILSLAIIIGIIVIRNMG